MANIDPELQAIREAVYGEEVRGSIVNALEAMNEQASMAQEWATGVEDPTDEPSATNNAKFFAEQAAASVEAAEQAVAGIADLYNYLSEHDTDGRSYNGVSFTWDGEILTVARTTTATMYYASYNIWGSPEALPENVYPGDNLIVTFRRVNPDAGTNVKFAIVVYPTEGDPVSNIVPEGEELVLTVPDDAVGIQARVYINSGTAANGEKLTDFSLRKGYTNGQLTERLMADEADLADVKDDVDELLERPNESEDLFRNSVIDTTSSVTVNGIKYQFNAETQIRTISQTSSAFSSRAIFGDPAGAAVDGVEAGKTYIFKANRLNPENGAKAFLRVTVYGESGSERYDLTGDEALITMPTDYTGLRFLYIVWSGLSPNSEQFGRPTIQLANTNAEIDGHVRSLEDEKIRYFYEGAFFSWTYGKTLAVYGDLDTASTFATTGYYPIQPGTVLENNMPVPDASGFEPKITVCFYDSNQTRIVYIRSAEISYPGKRIIAPVGAAFVRIAFGYEAGEGVPASSYDITNQYFRMKSSKPLELEKPLYVSFGASTTRPAVHHPVGPVTRSPFAYPQYIADALGMQSVNLAVGTNGMVSRANSGEPDNMMDKIYKSDAILQNASLITHMMGASGNDQAIPKPGTNPQQYWVLPYGGIHDYYPYDEEGYHPGGNTHAERLNACGEMIAKGATSLGCLNWMIHWLGTHYPKAQFILIFGAASQNNKRTINIVDNDLNPTEHPGQTEWYGHPKYKLEFTETRTQEQETFRQNVHTLCETYNITLIDLVDEGMPWTFWNTEVKNPDGTYILFSTDSDYEKNVHPADPGYLMWARQLAGLISSKFHPIK